MNTNINSNAAKARLLTFSPSPCAFTLPFSTPSPPMTVSRPNFLDTLSLLPLASRVGKYVYTSHQAGRTPIFDLNGITLQPPIPKPYAGVPCGGMGCGSIGRGFKGDFRRWSLSPGRYRHKTVCSNLFSFREKEVDSGVCSSVVLSVDDDNVPVGMKNWKWGSSSDIDLSSRSTYHALFPKSHTIYNDPTNTNSNAQVTIKQTSPFIPKNYSESSLPVVVFEVLVANDSEKQKEVSFMFTFCNDDGGDSKDDVEHFKCSAGREVIKKSSLFDCAGDGDGDMDANGACKGICMLHQRQRKVAYTTKENDDGDENNSCPFPWKPSKPSKSYTETVGFAISSPVEESIEISRVCNFDHDDEIQCDKLWNDFNYRGNIDNGDNNVNSKQQTSAICQTTTLKPKESKILTFALSWDSAMAMFGCGEGLPRRHSVFFPPSLQSQEEEEKEEATYTSAPSISFLGLLCRGKWEEQIDAWQATYLTNDSLPFWFRGQLFNELYYLVDGGTVWVDSSGGVSNNVKGEDGGVKSTNMNRSNNNNKTTPPNMNLTIWNNAQNAIKKMRVSNAQAQLCQGTQSVVGQFFYLEGHEYIMYNTLDVHFYASSSLTANFPVLQLSIMLDYSNTILKADNEQRKLLAHGLPVPRKVESAAVHDLGSPSEHPFIKVNSYNFQDVSCWKDLPCKFVLMVVRDCISLGLGEEEESDGDNDSSKYMTFLSSVYPSMVSCMHRASELWDVNKTGMIENSGFPDQTYDVWIATGVSTYTGGLWIAALFGMAKLALVMGDSEKAKMYENMAIRAKKVYNDKLWNGEYFDYDSSGGNNKNSTSIMADQLCGEWWCNVCALPSIVESPTQTFKTLTKIYDFNVVRWSEISGSNGLNGAVNGMKADGTVDTSCLQSKEVWAGTTYALSSLFLTASNNPIYTASEKKFLRHAAFETAKGIHDLGWVKRGYSFATPEAWDGKGDFRALGYMRALCIWSVAWGL